MCLLSLGWHQRRELLCPAGMAAKSTARQVGWVWELPTLSTHSALPRSCAQHRPFCTALLPVFTLLRVLVMQNSPVAVPRLPGWAVASATGLGGISAPIFQTTTETGRADEGVLASAKHTLSKHTRCTKCATPLASWSRKVMTGGVTRSPLEVPPGLQGWWGRADQEKGKYLQEALGT